MSGLWHSPFFGTGECFLAIIPIFPGALFLLFYRVGITRPNPHMGSRLESSFAPLSGLDIQPLCFPSGQGGIGRRSGGLELFSG